MFSFHYSFFVYGYNSEKKFFAEKFFEVFIATNRTKRSVEEDEETEKTGSGSKESIEFGEKKIKVDSKKKKGLRHFVP